MEKIHTEKAPAAIGPYSQAIVSGGLVFTSGQVPLDPATGENGPRAALALDFFSEEREQTAPSDPGGLPGVVPPTNSGARPLGSGWSSSPGGSLRHARPRPLRGSGRGSLSPARRPPRHHFKT